MKTKTERPGLSQRLAECGRGAETSPEPRLKMSYKMLRIDYNIVIKDSKSMQCTVYFCLVIQSVSIKMF